MSAPSPYPPKHHAQSFWEKENLSDQPLYQQRRVGDVTVLDLKGRVRIIGGTLALHKAIRCLVEEGKTQILLNLSQVTHIDSSGLGDLVASHITVNNKGGEIKLSHLTERLRDLMTITKLLTVFDVYDDDPKALASFTGEVLVVEESTPDSKVSLALMKSTDKPRVSKGDLCTS